MRRKLLDILACPIEKRHPLRLLEFSTKDPDVVVDGALLCDGCSRFYPIIDEIPVMLPDDLRSKKEDLEFQRSVFHFRLTQSVAPSHIHESFRTSLTW